MICYLEFCLHAKTKLLLREHLNSQAVGSRTVRGEAALPWHGQTDRFLRKLRQIAAETRQAFHLFPALLSILLCLFLNGRRENVLNASACIIVENKRQL